METALMIRQASLTRLGSMLNTAVGNSKKPGKVVDVMSYQTRVFFPNNPCCQSTSLTSAGSYPSRETKPPVFYRECQRMQEQPTVINRERVCQSIQRSRKVLTHKMGSSYHDYWGGGFLVLSWTGWPTSSLACPLRKSNWKRHGDDISLSYCVLLYYSLCVACVSEPPNG